MLKSHKFSFELLDEPGTAHAVYTVDDIENEFDLTNVCNPLDDMLHAIVSMLSTPTHLWGEANNAVFVWYCEDESYNWTFALAADNRLSIRLTQSCIFFGDDEVEIVNGDCDLFDFVSAIITELDRFIKETGVLNYHQRWKANAFPLTYFLILKKYLIDNGIWKPAPLAPDSPMQGEMEIVRL